MASSATVASLAEKDAEIGQLKAEKYTNDKLGETYIALNNQINKVAGDLATKDKVKQLIKPLDMLSDNGTFDVDQLHTNLTKTLEKFGGTFHVNYLNYNFDGEDLERIFGYLRGEL